MTPYYTDRQESFHSGKAQLKLMEMGRNEMVVWYQSPYPEEYTNLPKIYICEFCLKYMKFSSIMKRHASKCVWKHPPG